MHRKFSSHTHTQKKKGSASQIWPTEIRRPHQIHHCCCSSVLTCPQGSALFCNGAQRSSYLLESSFSSLSFQMRDHKVRGLYTGTNQLLLSTMRWYRDKDLSLQTHGSQKQLRMLKQGFSSLHFQCSSFVASQTLLLRDHTVLFKKMTWTIWVGITAKNWKTWFFFSTKNHYNIIWYTGVLRKTSDY